MTKSQYWILGEENLHGTIVLRKLATFPKDSGIETAMKIFDAIATGEAFEKVYLVEVIEEG